MQLAQVGQIGSADQCAPSRLARRLVSSVALRSAHRTRTLCEPLVHGRSAASPPSSEPASSSGPRCTNLISPTPPPPLLLRGAGHSPAPLTISRPALASGRLWAWRARRLRIQGDGNHRRILHNGALLRVPPCSEGRHADARQPRGTTGERARTLCPSLHYFAR